MRQELQVAGLVRVAAKPAGQGKASVHAVQEVGKVYQLPVIIWSRSGCCHPAVGNVPEQGLKLNLRLGAQVAQDGRLVQADRLDVLRNVGVAQVAVAQALVVGDEVGRIGGHRLLVGAHILEPHAHHRAVDLGELVTGAQRADLQHLGAGIAMHHLAQQLDLLAGLVHPELGRQEGPAALRSPAHGVGSVGFQRRVQLGRQNLKTFTADDVDLVFDNPAVVLLFE